ncbi:MAG: FAD-dependent oxidoreductase [Nocardioidaceae bacterium]
MTDVAIIGGGPGGYEAALVAAQLGAQVTLVDRDGVGGSAVLTDCVPSKTLIATAEITAWAQESGELGVRIGGQAEHGGVGRRRPRRGQRPRQAARRLAERRHHQAARARRACGSSTAPVASTGRSTSSP